MALRPLPHPLSHTTSSQSKLGILFCTSSRSLFKSQFRPSKSTATFSRSGNAGVLTVRACAMKLEEKNVSDTGSEWGKVSAVLFDMDGVLCNSEESSRLAAVDVFAEMGVQVTVEDFVPFMGTEPSGIVEADRGRIFIADTNSSQIRYLDLNNEEAELLTLELKGVYPPARKSRSLKRLRRRSSADTQIIVVDGGSSSEGSLHLKISVPDGYHFSKEAQSKFSVETEPENAANIDPLDGNLSPQGTAMLHFSRSSSSACMGRINCKVYYCKDDEVCLYQSLIFEESFKEMVAEATPPELTLPL